MSLRVDAAIAHFEAQCLNHQHFSHEYCVLKGCRFPNNFPTP